MKSRSSRSVRMLAAIAAFAAVAATVLVSLPARAQPDPSLAELPLPWATPPGRTR